MYETYNFLIKYIKDYNNISNLEKNYRDILICFSPVIPHLANECLSDIKEEKIIKWPKFDEKILEKEKINFVIQINGKKRLILNVKKNITEAEILELVKKDKITNKHLDEKIIKKIIFIENRLVNILTNE